MNMSDAGLFVTTGFTILMIYDAWVVYFRKGTGSSVSNYLIRVGFSSPPVVFGTAFLCGHLWGGMSLNEDPKWYTPGYNINFTISLVAYCAAVLATCFLIKRKRDAQSHPASL